MKALINRLIKEEEGQGLVEYALIIALVSVVLVAALGALAGADGTTGIGKAFADIQAQLE